MMYLKQSTAVTKKLGPFLDENNGKDTEEALAITQADIRVSKNGGAFAQTNNAAGATHDENGWYGVPLDTTDTDTLGSLQVAIHEGGALPVWKEYMVVPANVYDALVLGSDYLDVNAAQVEGTDPTDTIRNAITGGAYPLDTDANGRVRVVNGTGAGEIKLSSGYVNVLWGQLNAQYTDDLQADAGSNASTIICAELTPVDPAYDDYYKNRYVMCFSGDNFGAARRCTGYDAAATTLTFETPFEFAVIEDDFFNILWTIPPIIDSTALESSAVNEIIDGLLNRNINQGGSGTRTVGEALAFLRNRWTLVGTTLTVYDVDDVTPLWTGTVTKDAAADPVTASDPT